MSTFFERQNVPPTTVAPEVVIQRLLECRRDFLRYFRRHLGRPEDAEDALQDFCLRAVRAAGRLADSDKIDAWLSRILRSTLIDHYRRRAARQRAEVAYGWEAQETVFKTDRDGDGEPCGCVRRVLPMLRPDYAEILRRADLDEVPRKRIAAELELTANNVSVRLYRARRALKEKLVEFCPACRDGSFLRCDCERLACPEIPVREVRH